MMKLSSSCPNGRMLFESDSEVTSRANFSAEFNGGSGGADFADGTDWAADWSMISMSRAISSPEGSTDGAGARAGAAGGGMNSMLGCGATELTAAVANDTGSGSGSCG